MDQRSDNSHRHSPVKLIIWAGVTLLVVLNFSGVLNIFRNLFGVLYPLLLGAAIAYVRLCDNTCLLFSKVVRS